MSKLFNKLDEEGLFNRWAKLLDWLFDDDRFSANKGWTSGYVGSFIKKVKRMPNLGNVNYVYDSIKNLSFSDYKPKTLTIIHAKGSGESRDLVRHIRNGIAHGKTSLSKPEGELHIEILDYNKQKEQTAYIFMPLKYIFLIYDIYMQVEKSKNNSIKKRGKK